MSLNNGKTAGCDGIPIDFYKVFWVKVKHFFMELLQECYINNCLFPSALIGIINMIPKQNKDTRYLRNLRPITLLNADYKIIEKAIANRIELTLELIISGDQRGFLKQRRIHANVHTIYKLMKWTKNNNIEAFILSLDFKKCFDKIEIQSLIKAMRMFGFADFLIRWTSIIYSGFMVSTQNNGHFSNRFPVL